MAAPEGAAEVQHNHPDLFVQKAARRQLLALFVRTLQA